MTIFLLSGLINLSLALLILALTVLVIVVTVGQARKLVYLTVIDAIELRSRWVRSGLDLEQGQIELRHKSRMLEAEADTAQLPLRRERLGLLAALGQEEAKSEIS